MSLSLDQGIAVYLVPDAAHGDRKNYSVIALLKRLLRSLSEQSPDVPVAIWSDCFRDPAEFAAFASPIHLRSLNNACQRSGLEKVHRRLTTQEGLADGTRWCLACGMKQAVIRDSPFARTLYLDTDTLALRPIEPIFAIDEDCAMAPCHPAHAYEHQAGVMYVRRNAVTDAFLADWVRRWQAHRPLVGDNTLARPAVAAARKRGMSFRPLRWDVWNVRPHNIGHVPNPRLTRILHHRGIDAATFYATHAAQENSA